MSEHLVQTMIALTGSVAVWLTQDADPRRRRWACIVGMIGQPFWIYMSWTIGTWGVFLTSLLYTYAWARGIHLHWVVQQADATAAQERNAGALDSPRVCDCDWTPDSQDACRMCSGEICMLCGAGIWSHVDHCDHGSWERHLDGTAARDITQLK
jgi:hypothetical protein